MDRIYFDNAATTALDPLVLEAMMPYLTQVYGNPSSIHGFGRESKNAIEKARKTIASILNTSPSEILFTSGGTESDNTALTAVVECTDCKTIITSPIEHHAVLHTVEHLQKKYGLSVIYVSHRSDGTIDMELLEETIAKNPRSLVSIMHINNEIGIINDIETIASWCKNAGSYFHSDTVQSVGHHIFNLDQSSINFLVGSAHKFHGPKGVGFLYVQAGSPFSSYIHGGAQERNQRGGTENLASIVGMAKALELVQAQIKENEAHILKLKQHLINRLDSEFHGIRFNGNPKASDSATNIINISFPSSELNDMLLFNFDIEKIAVSGGSACNSGATVTSHVLEHLKADPDGAHVRVSLGKYNTLEEIDHFVSLVQQFYPQLSTSKP